MLRFIVIFLLICVIASLASSLYFLFKDKGAGKRRMVKALTLRVGLSLFLFVLLMAGYEFGYITGHL